MKKINLTPSGMIFLVLIIGTSLLAGASNYGTGFEKIISGINHLMTFLIIIALYGNWKKITLFKYKTLKFIALTYPALVIILPIYQLFEYSEQTMPAADVYQTTIGFLLSITISIILLKEAKK